MERLRSDWIQAASDMGSADALVLFLFDLLYVDGETISAAPLLERKERLGDLLSNIGFIVVLRYGLPFRCEKDDLILADI